MNNRVNEAEIKPPRRQYQKMITTKPESLSLHKKHGSSADKAWLSFIYQLPKIFSFQLLLLQDSIVEIAESHRQLLPMDILIRDVKHFAIFVRDAGM